MTAISPGDLARIESLGLNCEVGSVLRKLGDETPSLFRWTWAPPPAVLAALQADFAGLYEPQNMLPGGQNVVKDTRYDLLFHSNVKTMAVDGDWEFRFADPDERARTRILKAEKSLVEALVAKFRQRMTTPDTLYVLTRHAREPRGRCEDLVAAIRARSGRVPFSLIEVRVAEKPTDVARVEAVGPNLYRGFVARFAPYDQADDVDLDSWTLLLSRALAMAGRRPWWRALVGRRSLRSHAA